MGTGPLDLDLDRGSIGYLLAHYTILLLVIFLIVGWLELQLGGVPLWLGLGVAVLVGIVYPWFVREVDVAPERWVR